MSPAARSVRGAARDAFDVVVLGGGPAGTATALALAQRGVDSVLVAEAGDYHGVRVGESVPPDIRWPLEALGLWRDFLRQGHEPCPGSAAAWGGPELGYNDFLVHPLGNGWHLDRSRFDAQLAESARAAGARVETGCRLVALAADADERRRLVLRSGDGGERRVSARFVVDATGIASAFARRVGARQRLADRLLAVYGFCTVGGEATLSRMTLLEAVPDGWWYAARLPGDRAAVAFASDADLVRDGGLRDPVIWHRRLAATRHLAPALEGCRFEGRLVARSAPSFLLDRVAGHRWLAVGDAASATDPLVSRGLHASLSQAPKAAGAVAGALSGDRQPLRGYARSLAERFDAYLVARRHLYDLERRWPEARFWRRRRRAGSLPDAARRPVSVSSGDRRAAATVESPG